MLVPQNFDSMVSTFKGVQKVHVIPHGRGIHDNYMVLCRFLEENCPTFRCPCCYLPLLQEITICGNNWRLVPKIEDKLLDPGRLEREVKDKMQPVSTAETSRSLGRQSTSTIGLIVSFQRK